MSVFLRSRLSLRATPSIAARQLAPLRSAYPLGQRFYAHSSYGGDGETEAQQPDNPRNQPTRDIEHPGPPPPDTGSNSTDGDESPYVDKDGHTTADAPEDVRRHNEEIEKRADRPTERAG
ncbi:Tic20-like family protein [Aspergillus niger]|uniref:Tic20-like family protein n=1 Tax=Aspergillus niger TaxID=5061 RepID=A0A505ICU0_ASPNG|nr:Tic20-like family protein [Aspergillus niger]